MKYQAIRHSFESQNSVSQQRIFIPNRYNPVGTARTEAQRDHDSFDEYLGEQHCKVAGVNFAKRGGAYVPI